MSDSSSLEDGEYVVMEELSAVSFVLVLDGGMISAEVGIYSGSYCAGVAYRTSCGRYRDAAVIAVVYDVCVVVEAMLPV